MGKDGIPVAVTLTGVNDEPTREWALAPALDALEAVGTRFVELRAVDGKNVDDMSDEEFARAWDMIRARGFSVTAYDSNLGKCELAPENFGDQEQRLRRAIARTDATGTRLIRTMGFRRGACSVREWRDRTLDWFDRLARIAADAGKTLMLENCLDRDASMGCSPDDCLDIMRSVDSPYLRMNLDPGNFANWAQDPVRGAELLAGYTVNMHVKDRKPGGERSEYCLAGDGTAGIREVLAILKRSGFAGNVTIEPHLRMRESYHYSGWDDYVAAGKRIHELLLEAGFEVVT